MPTLRFIVRLFALIGLLFVAGAAGAGYWLWQNLAAPASLPPSIVLDLNLTDTLQADNQNPFDLVLNGGRRLSLADVTDALERARKDTRVKGVAVRLGSVEPGLADTQEIMAAIRRFTKTGRFATAWADAFWSDGTGSAMHAYTLASSTGDIWVQPEGSVNLQGVLARTPFARDALDWLGVSPEIQKRTAYKTAANTLTERGFTPEHKEMMLWLTRDLLGQMVADIAAARSLTEQSVRAAIDIAPLSGQQAQRLRLIDHIGWHNDWEAVALTRAGAGAKMVNLSDYLASTSRSKNSGETIALVDVTGEIERGFDTTNLFSDRVASADTIAETIVQAANSPKIKAIILRINSPGGSVTGSQTIRSAVKFARKAGKPVVAQMGELAASGGYYIAADADRIVAAPATLTGSIGVIGGKVVLAGLWERLGIGWGQVEAGTNAGMFSELAPFTPEQTVHFTKFIDETYTNFVQLVAFGRRMSVEAVEAVAGGRVWTGRQALDLGLIDTLGGLEEALAEVRQLTGLREDAAVKLENWPLNNTLVDRLTRLVSAGLDHASSRQVTNRQLAFIRQRLAPVAHLLAPTGDQWLRMPNMLIQ